MKKIILATVLSASPVLAFAAGGHGPAGCGLGTEVIFADANEWHEHVLAATTNGTSGNQTFGMTSGTLGCEDANGPLAAGAQQFIDGNMDRLAADIAVGKGETLDALNEILQVEEQDKAVFVSALKSNFNSIFPSNETNSSGVYDAIATILAQDATLSKYVS